MAFNIEPECRYGHGRMVASTNLDESVAHFAAVAVTQNQVNLGHIYAFNVYECPICSYLEFHDSEPKKK